MMKADPEVSNIGHEAAQMMKVATELFVKHLASKAHEQMEADKKKSLVRAPPPQRRHGLG